MLSLKSNRRPHAPLMRPMVLMLAIFLLFSFAASVNSQPIGREPRLAAKPSSPATSSNRFTGALTVRQKGGSLYYKIYIVRGEVIGGYDTWRGRSMHHHRIVGGWYDGDRMVLLIQSAQRDFGSKWYSHAHHFEKKNDQFVLTHTLYGFGKTMDSGEVYQPHIIDEISELPAEQVQRMAATAKRGSTPPVIRDSGHIALKTRSKQIKRENARLKELVADLVLEKRQLQRKLREK